MSGLQCPRCGANSDERIVCNGKVKPGGRAATVCLSRLRRLVQRQHRHRLSSYPHAGEVARLPSMYAARLLDPAERPGARHQSDDSAGVTQENPLPSDVASVRGAYRDRRAGRSDGETFEQGSQERKCGEPHAGRQPSESFWDNGSFLQKLQRRRICRRNGGLGTGEEDAGKKDRDHSFVVFVPRSRRNGNRPPSSRWMRSIRNLALEQANRSYSGQLRHGEPFQRLPFNYYYPYHHPRHTCNGALPTPAFAFTAFFVPPRSAHGSPASRSAASCDAARPSRPAPLSRTSSFRPKPPHTPS